MAETTSPGEAPEAVAARLAEAPVTLVGSRRKTVRIALISLGFVLLGAWEIRRGGTWFLVPVALVGGAALVLGLLGGAAAALRLARPTRLILTDRGFTMAGSMRSSELRWSEVERFGPWRPNRLGPVMVGYWRRGPPRTGVEALARGFGCDGAIPDDFTLPAPALLGLCEACRRRWG